MLFAIDMLFIVSSENGSGYICFSRIVEEYLKWPFMAWIVSREGLIFSFHLNSNILEVMKTGKSI